MSYLTYKVLHLVGAFFLFSALAGLVVAAKHNDAQYRKIGSIVHGISLLVILVSGFGALAKLGANGVPTWVWIKLVIWLALGGIVVLIKRWEAGRMILWLIIPLIGAIAAYLGIFHPPVG